MIALCLLFSLAASAGDRLLLITHLMLSVTISGSEVSLVSFVVRPDHFVPDGLGCDFLPFIGNVFAMDAGFLKLDDRFHEGCHRVEFIVRFKLPNERWEGLQPSYAGLPRAAFAAPSTMPSKVAQQTGAPNTKSARRQVAWSAAARSRESSIAIRRNNCRPFSGSATVALISARKRARSASSFASRFFLFRMVSP
jgi:hypothetical protein